MSWHSWTKRKILDHKYCFRKCQHIKLSVHLSVEIDCKWPCQRPSRVTLPGSVVQLHVITLCCWQVTNLYWVTKIFMLVESTYVSADGNCWSIQPRQGSVLIKHRILQTGFELTNVITSFNSRV
jgi:hypothetical protein